MRKSILSMQAVVVVADDLVGFTVEHPLDVGELTSIPVDSYARFAELFPVLVQTAQAEANRKADVIVAALEADAAAGPPP